MIETARARRATNIRDDERAALVDASPPDAAALPSEWPAVYADLAPHNAALRRLLTRFVLARTNAWAPSFFEQLLLS